MTQPGVCFLIYAIDVHVCASVFLIGRYCEHRYLRYCLIEHSNPMLNNE